MIASIPFLLNKFVQLNSPVCTTAFTHFTLNEKGLGISATALTRDQGRQWVQSWMLWQLSIAQYVAMFTCESKWRFDKQTSIHLPLGNCILCFLHMSINIYRILLGIEKNGNTMQVVFSEGWWFITSVDKFEYTCHKVQTCSNFRLFMVQ